MQLQPKISDQLLSPLGVLLLLSALAVGGVFPGLARAIEIPGPLVDTQWLADHLNQVVILDVRRDPQTFIRKAGGGEVGGIQACGAGSGGGGLSGHIPGAALIEWKEIAVKHKLEGIELFDTLPDAASFTALMQRSGVNQDSAIVIATPGDSAPAVADGTRLYWTLKYFGHDNVALLDGGVAKWASEKRKLEYGRSKPGNGNWQASAERAELLATLDEVAAMSSNGQIIDVRTPEYYLGLRYKSDKVKAPGHIDGAKNLPFSLYIKESPEGSTFYPVNEIKRVATQLGIALDKPTISHCNTGHLASSGWFVMSELLGNRDVQLYDGSMNEWAALSRPISRDLQ